MEGNASRANVFLPIALEATTISGQFWYRLTLGSARPANAARSARYFSDARTTSRAYCPVECVEPAM